MSLCQGPLYIAPIACESKSFKLEKAPTLFTAKSLALGQERVRGWIRDEGLLRDDLAAVGADEYALA
jgi:hypothetical protein